jgi:hypothetical protein
VLPAYGYLPLHVALPGLSLLLFVPEQGESHPWGLRLWQEGWKALGVGLTKLVLSSHLIFCRMGPLRWSVA